MNPVLDFLRPNFRPRRSFDSQNSGTVYYLLTDEETSFMSTYGLDKFNEMKESEGLSQVENLLAKHQGISKEMRARYVNWLL